MSVAFVNIDTLKDFMHPDGKLYVKDAEQILPNLKSLTYMADSMDSAFVLDVCDYHSQLSKEISDAPDYKTTFPPHAMIGTKGCQQVDESQPVRGRPPSFVGYHESVKPVPEVKTADHIILTKDHFDMFIGNRHTETVLEMRQPVNAFFVYGVASNICIDAAVMQLVMRYGDKSGILVVSDAIKELPGTDVNALFKKWTKAGVQLTTTTEVIEAGGIL